MSFNSQQGPPLSSLSDYNLGCWPRPECREGKGAQLWLYDNGNPGRHNGRSTMKFFRACQPVSWPLRGIFYLQTDWIFPCFKEGRLILHFFTSPKLKYPVMYGTVGTVKAVYFDFDNHLLPWNIVTFSCFTVKY